MASVWAAAGACTALRAQPRGCLASAGSPPQPAPPPPTHTPPLRPPQALRAGLLDWVCHVVVANGALVQTVLQTLVYSLLPPPGPPLPDPNPGEAWEPQPGQAAVQDEVVAALEKVGTGLGLGRVGRGAQRQVLCAGSLAGWGAPVSTPLSLASAGALSVASVLVALGQYSRWQPISMAQSTHKVLRLSARPAHSLSFFAPNAWPGMGVASAKAGRFLV